MSLFNNRKIGATRLIALSFVMIILIGALILTLPISSKAREFTPFVDALFTAASATCVTGLIVYDTYTHWSLFGQLVIILLIQIGGLGFITIITMFSILTGKKIGLFERTLVMESVGFLQLGGAVRMVIRLFKGTFLIEGIGAVLLSLKFIPRFGFIKGVYYGIFHSVSAFCNAGFDLMGVEAPFSSVTSFSQDAVVTLTISALIIIGGIGFLVWDDVLINKRNFSKYKLHSKIVLTFTATLIVVGTLGFLMLESNHAFKDMGAKETVLSAFFASVSPRTAGFNSVDLAKLGNASIFLTIILMAVGASPGSTGGGLKTTTVAVMLLSAISSSRDSGSVNAFKRRIDGEALKKASAISTIYFVCAALACLLLLAFEPFSVKEVMFEVFSAIGTVGLTLGITTELTGISKIIIILLMTGGRVGSLTVALALTKKRETVLLDRPEEKITVG